MYVIILRYNVNLSEMDEHRDAHIKWLELHYASGLFIASGRQNPPIGGVIISGPIARSDLENILKTDPFAIHDLAEYDIIEFESKMTCAALKEHV